MTDTHKTSDIANCRVIELPRHTHPNGSLTEVENSGAFPFSISRIFYLYDVPADSERGGHSHHLAEELIVAVSGSFDVTLDDGASVKTFSLNRPYKALYICPGVWRTLQNFSAGSVCLVLTSKKYSEDDYVREYARFQELTSSKRKNAARFPFLNLEVVNRPFAAEIRDAVTRVAASGRYIGGKEVADFEEALAAQCGARFAVGVSNGLDALRLIFRAYMECGRLKKGDRVIVPANTYIASVLAVTDMGLTPVFIEPDPETLNLDPQKVAEALTPDTKAVMVVHLYGRACWDDQLARLAAENNLLVIEDNAQAIGAQALCPGVEGGTKTGNIGHAAAFSFYPTKNIGAIGDAGAVTTSDPEIAAAVRAVANYGSDRRYHNVYTGYNCRLDPMQAAVLTVKLPHLEEENIHRQAIARAYNENIQNPAVTLPRFNDDGSMVWHQYVVRVKDRDAFRHFLAANGVETDIHYATPPHRQPCYSEYASLPLPITDMLASEVVSLPITRCTSIDDALRIACIINSWHKD